MMVLFGFAVMVLIGTGAIWCRSEEKKEWNNGRCGTCGCAWYSFDQTSQGDRGYRCTNGHYTWISYRVDRDYDGITA